jgi:hypothetical protein
VIKLFGHLLRCLFTDGPPAPPDDRITGAPINYRFVGVVELPFRSSPGGGSWGGRIRSDCATARSLKLFTVDDEGDEAAVLA